MAAFVIAAESVGRRARKHRHGSRARRETRYVAQREREFAVDRGDWCGGFLERDSRYFEVFPYKFGKTSLESTDPQAISSVCAVLAESETINDVSYGRSVADILCGAHQSLAERALSQLKIAGLDGDGVFLGSVAVQEGMVKACREKFDTTVLVPEFPSHVVAYGAAILGLQRYRKREMASVSA